MTSIVIMLSSLLAFAIGVRLGRWERRARVLPSAEEIVACLSREAMESLEQTPATMRAARWTSENRTDWIH